MFGLDLSPEGLLAFFSQYAYQPWLVYGFISAFMLMASFGLPIPEEVVLISAGLVAYLAKNPQLYPPPYPGAHPVDTTTLMVVCFLAVFFSDFIVYSLGRFLGQRLMHHHWVKKQMEGKTYITIEQWFVKYGSWCAGIFRFTPGLRFPGHLSCGFLKVPLWKFIAIDGGAALLSVPTQVWLVATYGEVILEKMKEFKLILLGVLLFVGLIWWLRKRKQDTALPS